MKRTPKRWQAALCRAALVALLPCVLSCKQKTPDGVLGVGEMENVLYDYHLAQGLAQQAPTDSAAFYQRYYKECVFRKYGISQKTFDASMEWYERHTDKLQKIYATLAERLGGTIDGDVPVLANGSLGGDTLSLWRGANTVMLHSQGMNHYTHTQPADTAYKEGDMLQWKFNTEWYYHEGERRVAVCAVVHYEGDSIATTRKNVYSDGEQILSMRLGKRKVQRVDFIVYQCAPWADRPRIALIKKLQMLRIRPIAAAEPVSDRVSPIKSDSTPARPLTPQHRLRDSLLRADTADRRRSHFQ